MAKGGKKSAWMRFWTGEMFPDPHPEQPEISYETTREVDSNTCFCGCGQKLGFLDRRISKNGRTVAALVRSLRTMEEEIVAIEEALDETPESRRISAALSPYSEASSVLIGAGEELESTYEAAIHGFVPPTSESRQIQEVFFTFRSASKKILSEWRASSLRSNLRSQQGTG